MLARVGLEAGESLGKRVQNVSDADAALLSDHLSPAQRK